MPGVCVWPQPRPEDPLLVVNPAKNAPEELPALTAAVDGERNAPQTREQAEQTDELAREEKHMTFLL